MSLLRVEDLCIDYGQQRVVDHISFTIGKGEAVGIVGESGSGKTQTALAVPGLLPASARRSGSIVFDGQELLGASEAALNSLRATHIAMVFQDPAQALNPCVRIGKQLRRILTAHGLAAGQAAGARVLDMLDKVGLPDPGRQFDAYPHQLSGGMQQRVMIAAALIAEPDLLIADEPTTALDVTVQAQILALLDTLRRDTSLLLITHDLGIIAQSVQRMLVFENGRLVEQGRTHDVFAAPAHEHTRTLLAAAPRLDRGDVRQAESNEALLSVSDVAVSYRPAGGGTLHAVRDLALTVNSGETLAIVGESGSGKSSFVRALLGLVPMQSGRVNFDGEPQEMQMVFQDPLASLNPQLRVQAIVAEPLTVRRAGKAAVAAPERLQRVTAALQQVGLDSSFLTRYPHQLSGGQAQRVAIARALILRPRLLICDEAVAALDGSVRQQILELLQGIQAATGLSMIFISHDLAVVRTFSHRVAVMQRGRVVEYGDNATLFAKPQHSYTRALLDAVPVPDPGRSELVER